MSYILSPKVISKYELIKLVQRAEKYSSRDFEVSRVKKFFTVNSNKEHLLIF